jgi:hypothetical protein
VLVDAVVDDALSPTSRSVTPSSCASGARTPSGLSRKFASVYTPDRRRPWHRSLPWPFEFGDLVAL